jgi:transposase
MSLKLGPIQLIPEETIQVARAAFPKGNLYLTLRDKLGSIFQDEDFAGLFPPDGQPALPPWRLALVTILQFRENLSDRQAAEAVRGRIDWKYLLGLELTDAGFDFSVLSEFRGRLLEGGQEAILLEKLLECCQAQGLIKARGKQRTDATRVLAAIRVLTRLELVGETMRAALNELATIAPDWLAGVAPAEWYQRYSRRIEDDRLPQSNEKRTAYAQTVGEDGFLLVDLLQRDDVPGGLDRLPRVEALRLVWERHYEHTRETQSEVNQIRFRSSRELPPAAEGIESPYDPEARFRSRHATTWTGYQVHLSETCEPDAVHLITHVETTLATVHESQKTEAIHQALVNKGLPPDQHLVDSAYIDAKLLISSREQFDITLVGPGRLDNSWQAKVKGACDRYCFEIDWDGKQARCPQGKLSKFWRELADQYGPYYQVIFDPEDCRDCQARSLCTRTKAASRRLRLQPRPQFEALLAARQLQATEAGRQLYAKRAGVEGTISQGVRGFGLRRSRYWGLAKTHFQHLATAAAINLDRLGAWFDNLPLSKTRTALFARLAPLAA